MRMSLLEGISDEHRGHREEAEGRKHIHQQTLDDPTSDCQRILRLAEGGAECILARKLVAQSWLKG